MDPMHLEEHNQVYHNVAEGEEEEELPNNYVSPYRFLKNCGKYLCVLGCEFACEMQSEIRQHMVDSHTDEQCDSWGYSRDLLYQEYLKQ